MRAPDFSTRARRPEAPPADVTLLAAALLFLTLSAYSASAAWADLGRARRAAEAERREARQLGEKARALEARRGGAEGALSAQIVLNAEAPPPRVLGDLAALLPPDVRLDGISLAYGTRLGVEARVAARHAGAYDLFLKRLGESPRFGEIVPGAENREGEVKASVQMTYRGEAGP